MAYVDVGSGPAVRSVHKNPHPTRCARPQLRSPGSDGAYVPQHPNEGCRREDDPRGEFLHRRGAAKDGHAKANRQGDG